jgi:hypothetical protein
MENNHWEANRFKIVKKSTAFVEHEALPKYSTRILLPVLSITNSAHTSQYILQSDIFSLHLSKESLYAFLISSTRENAALILPLFIITKQYFVTTANQKLVIKVYIPSHTNFIKVHLFSSTFC